MKKPSRSQQKKAPIGRRRNAQTRSRYVPSGKFFARIRVAGKLIRSSLKTNVISVAKLSKPNGFSPAWPPNWLPLATNSGTGAPIWVTNALTATNRFYRVRFQCAHN